MLSGLILFDGPTSLVVSAQYNVLVPACVFGQSDAILKPKRVICLVVSFLCFYNIPKAQDKMNRKQVAITISGLLLYVSAACQSTLNPTNSFAPNLSATSLSAISDTSTPVPSPTRSLTSILTKTVIPTNTVTPTPTATPTPMGGGGKLVMFLYRTLAEKLIEPVGDISLFTVNPDESNWKPLLMEGREPLFTSLAISPDRRKALIIDHKSLDLLVIDMDNHQIQIITSDRVKLAVGIDWPTRPTMWLPDGRILFVGQDEKGAGLFITNSAGHDPARLGSADGYQGLASFIALSPTGESVYWVNGDRCNQRGICNERYFATQFDNSQTAPVWQNIRGAAGDLFFSPDGEWIAYSTAAGCQFARWDGEEIQKVEPLPSEPRNWRVDCRTYETLLEPTSPWRPNRNQLIVSDCVRKSGEKDCQVTISLLTVPDNQQIPIFIFPKPKPAGGLYRYQWSPDGNFILIVDPNHGAPRLASIVDGAIQTLPEGLGNCGGVEFSPDGNQIIFYDCKKDWQATLAYRYDKAMGTTSLLSSELSDIPIVNDPVGNRRIMVILDWMASR